MTGTVLKKIIMLAVSFIIAAAFSISASASPALKGTFVRTQPDGTCFYVSLTGDEFTRLAVTSDGRPVIKDGDGWYCYAEISPDGKRRSSGVRVPGTKASAGQMIAAQGGIGRTQGGRPANSVLSAVNAASRARREVMGRLQERAAERTRAASEGSEVRAIILLAQFSDLKFTYTRSDFEKMVNQQGYSSNGATGSIRDYFSDQFGDGKRFTFDIGPVVTLSKGYAYYGKNDDDGDEPNAHEAVIEACKLSDSEVDFSSYDLDGDGNVDNIFVFYAGTDEARGADEDHIWSQSWALKDGVGITVMLDGVCLNEYAMTSEIAYYPSLGKSALAPVGSFCHEFGHTLGLKDMYDTDYEDSDGKSKGVWGSISLMDSGNYNNEGRTPPNFTALEMDMMGIGECRELKVGSYNLTAGEKVYYKSGTDVKGESYYFECRYNEGWDKYIGGNGLLIYHVDRSEKDAGYSTNYERVLTAEDRFTLNEINCRPDHMCAYLVGTKSSCSSISEVFWPNGSRNSFTASTSPAFVYWSGAKSEVSLSDISRSGKSVSFNVSGPATITSVEVFQDAAIVCWESGMGGTEDCNIKWSGGGKTGSASASPYEFGKYAYTIEGLSEKTDYAVSVYFGNAFDEASIRTFTTRAYYSSGYPFIYLSSAERRSDGTFVSGARIPLRVYNAKGVAKVSWYFGNESISSALTGYYTLNSSGVLKAVVQYEDGSTDIITKNVTVK